MSREALAARIAALIDRLADGTRDDAARDALLAELAAWQREAIPAYARLWARSREPVPAVPTDVFRFARLAAHPASLDQRVFCTSGTTAEQRGQHALRDLSLYDRAARAAARLMLFPDVERMRLVVLAPHERQAPESSLSYMLSRFEGWFSRDTTWVWRDDALDLPALTRALDTAVAAGEPVAVLGTSFAFVHADDGLERRFSLPAGSRVMQTGGFKGKSRALEPAEMRALLSVRYGVPDSHIVAEYGMTELSSQLYETSLRDALAGVGGPRRLWIPGWVRVAPVDAETLAPVASGIGLLRIDDLANLDSIAAIQTSDLAERVADGVVVHGRAADATPRGCSRAADAILGGEGRS